MQFWDYTKMNEAALLQLVRHVVCKGLVKRPLRRNKAPMSTAPSRVPTRSPRSAVSDMSSCRPKRVLPEFGVHHLLFLPGFSTQMCFSSQRVGLVCMLLTFTCHVSHCMYFSATRFSGGWVSSLGLYSIYLVETPHLIYSFSCQRFLFIVCSFAITHLLL